MKSRLTRALLVVAVFALLGVLAATGRRVNELGAPAPPRPASVPAAAPGTAQGGPRAAGPPRTGESAPGRSPGTARREANRVGPSTTTQPGPTASLPKVARPRSQPHPPLTIVFLNAFRNHFSWAIVAPGILWLARRVPLFGRRWALALAFHAVVPVAASLPFFFFRFLVNFAFGVPLPTWSVLTRIPWDRIWVMQVITAVPIYWLLVGLGTMVAFVRERHAREMAEVELRRSLDAAQLDGLRFKLQPHFLFNTLNAIATFARAGDTDGAGRVVERLGTLLRLSMETSGRQLVTLEEELALVDAYLAIEEIRFGDRLRVVRRIAPGTCRALVPNLILQPLVENALVHGLSRRLDATLLEVAARREGRVLHIAVRDDGPGLPAAWNLERDAGAGLRNVHDRIAGLFPGESGFQMENGATGGALALLSIPFADAETTAIAAEGQPWIA